MSDPVQAAVALGSNLGDREDFLERACAAMASLPGTRVTRRSRLIETAPVGGPRQGPYLNGVVLLSTTLPAAALLRELLSIEARLGRVRRERNGPRVIDLDLILYGAQVIDEPGLQVPHPRAHERDFVLAPLAEVAGDWPHPVLRCTIDTLWRQSRSSRRGVDAREPRAASQQAGR